MPKTIPESFKKFRSNLEITDLQKETVQTRRDKVREVLDNGLTVLESFLTGSYSRHTMIAPLKKADIDIFVVLDRSYYKKYGQASLLDKVKGVLKKTYTKTPKISRNGQAVTITFTDFMVDVVPAFNRKGGGFLIPNSVMGKWISTDPMKHIPIFSKANTAHNGDLVPLIKMVKCWNLTIGYYFSSFHLEVLALQILQGVTISDFPSGARYVFDKARDRVTKKNPDPAGYNDDVGKYLTKNKLEGAVSRFETAYKRAKKAEDYAKEEKTEAAVGEWKKIFGDRFPSYG